MSPLLPLTDLDIDVVVPSYRRAAELTRCLDGLRRQSLLPSTVIVVARNCDIETQRLVRSFGWERLSLVEVNSPGMVAAMQRGAGASTAEIVAFTDDDAIPRPDWLERIREQFATSPSTGAVGGRDIVAGDDSPRRRDVGRIKWYGRLIGNHHLGKGQAQVVDCLKGVNMAFRATHLAFPRLGLLRGEGAQPNNEPLMCRWVQKQHLKIVYDPEIIVDHYPAERTAGDRRTHADRQTIVAAAHNRVVSLSAIDRGRIPSQVFYAFLIGGRAYPGIAWALVAIAMGKREVAVRLGPSMIGLAAALVTLSRVRKRNSLLSCVELRDLAQE